MPIVNGVCRLKGTRGLHSAASTDVPLAFSGMTAHIGLNLIFLVPGETGGMEVAARELVRALVVAAPDTHFTAFINRETAEREASAGAAAWGAMVETVTVPVRARNRFEWVRGEQQLLPRMAAAAGVDLLHSLASTAPAWGRFRRIVTVYDLIYARYPEAHQRLRALGMRVLVPLAVRRSERVIVPSESTRRDLLGILGTESTKIDVVPLGVGKVGGGAALDAARTRARFELGDRRVLLSPSAKRPHKNLAALLEALALIPARRRPLLVVPGYQTWYERLLRDRTVALELVDDVRFPGWVSDDELEGLWSVADATVFPSLYEGFGLPVLEAMARGVPVACSTASSLPEVAGDAALLFEPRDTAAIAAAIERLLGDEDEAARLRAAGRERASRFTWERTARATLDVYRRTLE